MRAGTCHFLRLIAVSIMLVISGCSESPSDSKSELEAQQQAEQEFERQAQEREWRFEERMQRLEDRAERRERELEQRRSLGEQIDSQIYELEGRAAYEGRQLTDWEQQRVAELRSQSMVLSIYGFISDVPGECPPERPVKVNLSLESGELIYHLPGWKFYEATLPEFCERSARAAERSARPSKIR